MRRAPSSQRNDQPGEPGGVLITSVIVTGRDGDYTHEHHDHLDRTAQPRRANTATTRTSFAVAPRLVARSRERRTRPDRQTTTPDRDDDSRPPLDRARGDMLLVRWTRRGGALLNEFEYQALKRAGLDRETTDRVINQLAELGLIELAPDPTGNETRVAVDIHGQALAADLIHRAEAA